MQISMLGPLEVRSGEGTGIEVAGTRLRAALIALALEPGQVVPADRMIDAVWGQDAPAAAGNALQALVSRLRRILPVESRSFGYLLPIDPEAVDVSRFERLVARARTEPGQAGPLLHEALDLWRGPALADVAEIEYFQPVIARLAELRLAAVEEHAETELQSGRAAEVAGELSGRAAADPLRERLVGILMRALCAVGRQAEALTAYERTRVALADFLGADPSAELSALHAAILRGELAAVPSTVDGPRTNLRAPMTSFIGRDRELREVGKLVEEYRLSTLTGPGGAGKTRLATEVAQAAERPAGVWFVELARLGDAAEVPQAALGAMGVREHAHLGPAPATEPIDRLIGVLSGGAALLVLDNCEHLIGPVAALAERLLGACPRLHILATSREPLGITGEALWPVEPLTLPAAAATAAEAMACTAVRLLADRAAAARPGFTVDAGTVGAVVQICRALDGMPLAIELAAARMRTMTAPQLAGRLDDRFRLLTGGSRTALPRQQTLRAVVDWSWDLLSDDERRLLRRLTVFQGGATFEAAERVCGDGADILGPLTSLTEKSLLVQEAAEEPRYGMLETIRAYGRERLAEAGETDQVRTAHADYFAELAETADPHLRRAEQLHWLHLLAAEHDNINAALRGAITAQDAQTALRLVAAAGWYWWLGGHKAEGADLAAAALSVPGAADATTRATVYAICGIFATAGLGDAQEARVLIDSAMDLTDVEVSRNPLLRSLGPLQEMSRTGTVSESALEVIEPLLDDEDPWVRAQARLNGGRILLILGGPRRAGAEEWMELALAEFRALGERWGLSYALWMLADLKAQRGDLRTALDYLDQAVVVVTEIGSIEDAVFMQVRRAQLRWLAGDEAGSEAALTDAGELAARVGWPDALAGLAHSAAELARWKGDPAQARAELLRAEQMLRDISIHPVFRAMILDSRAYLDAADGDLDTARTLRAEALGATLDYADMQIAAQILVGVAEQALHQGQLEHSAQLLAAAESLRGGPDLFSPDGSRIEASVRAALDADAYAAAAGRGRGVTAEAVRTLAASVLSDSDRA